MEKKSGSVVGNITKGSDGHVIVREGVLLEKEVYLDPNRADVTKGKSDSVAGDVFDETDEWDQDTVETVSNGGFVEKENRKTQRAKWRKKNVLLFANGNFVIHPHSKKGFHIWPFKAQKEGLAGSSKYFRTRVLSLDNVGFKDVQFDRDSSLFTFRIYPHRNTIDEIVLGFSTEKHAKNWFRDILGVACIVSPASKKSGATDTPANPNPLKATKVLAARARAAWKQAYYEIGVPVPQLPMRYWDYEYSPTALRGDALKAFRLWRDFTSYTLSYAEYLQSYAVETVNMEIDSNQRLSLLNTGMLQPPNSIAQTRMHDAMQLFFDAKNVLLVLQGGETKNGPESFPLSTTVQLNGTGAVFSTVLRPPVLDVELSSLLTLDRLSTVFTRRCLGNYSKMEPSLVVEAENGQTQVRYLPPADQEEQNHLLTAIVNPPVNSELIQVREGALVVVYALHDKGVPENEAGTSLVGKTVRGTIVILPVKDELFIHAQNKQQLLRPEYAVCRLSMFRDYFYRLGNAPKPGPVPDNVKEAEIKIGADINAYCVYAAVSRLTFVSELITHPQQVITLLHAHGVELSLQSLYFFRDAIPRRIAYILHKDLVMEACFGNIAASMVYMSAFSYADSFNDHPITWKEVIKRQKADVIHAFLRKFGCVLKVSSLLRDCEQVVALFDGHSKSHPARSTAIAQFLDTDYRGVDNSYLQHGGTELYVQRLSRGINRCTIRDETNPSFKENPIDSRNPLLLAATILNRSTFSLEHNLSRYNNKVQESPILAMNKYASSCAIVFGNLEAKDNKNAWWLASHTQCSPQILPCFTWLQIMLDRVSAYCNQPRKNRRDEQYTPIVDAVDSAFNMVRNDGIIMAFPCIVARAATSNLAHDVIVALRLLRIQHFADCSLTIYNLLCWLLLGIPVETGVPWTEAQSSLIERSIRVIGQKPPKRTRKISRARIMKTCLLSKRPLQAVMFESDSFVLGKDLQDLFSTYFSTSIHDMAEEFSVGALEEIFPPLPVGSEPPIIEVQRDNDGTESDVSHIGNMLVTHGTTHDDDDEDYPSAANRAGKSNSILIQGVPLGMSLESEQMLTQSLKQSNLDSFRLSKEEKQAMERLDASIVLSSTSFPRFIEVVALSCGNRHSAIVTKAGLCFTFGYGGAGRLGHGDEKNYASPKLVEELVTHNIAVRGVACGRDHTVIFGSHNGRPGKAYAWGWGEAGRLGQGKEVGIETLPLKISTYVIGPGNEIPDDGVVITQAACGYEHTLLLSDQGHVFSFGAGNFGRLGQGNSQDLLSPTQIHSNLEDEKIVAIATGDAHSLALSGDGVVYSWGFGKSGALGHGDLANRMEPKRVAMLQDSRYITKIAAGSYSSAAIDNKGRVWTWGDYQNGQLGIAETRHGENTIPRMVRFKAAALNSSIVDIACGANSTLAIDSSGVVYKWGHPEFVRDGLKIPTIQQHAKIRRDSVATCIAVGAVHSIVYFTNRPEKFERPSIVHRLEPKATVDNKNDLEYEYESPQHRSGVEPKKVYPKLVTGGSTQSQTLFAGSLYDRFDKYVSREQTALTEELNAFKNCGQVPKTSFPDRTLRNIKPVIQHRTPKSLTALNGLAMKSALGTPSGWTLTTTGCETYKWGAAHPRAILGITFSRLNLRVEQACSNSTGRWFAAVVENPSNCSSNNVIFWEPSRSEIYSKTGLAICLTSRGSREKNEFDPTLLWPAHNQMKIRSISIGTRHAMISDQDGDTYEVQACKSRALTDEQVESPETGKRIRIKNRIRRVYQKYKPDKMREAPAFLRTMFRLYEKREEELLGLLVKKYGPEPLEREACGPCGFEKQHPRLVSFPQKGIKVVQVACGKHHSLALSECGKIFSWTSCEESEITPASLGQGMKPTVNFRRPTLVVPKLEHPYPPNGKALFAKISAGENHNLAVTLGGSLFSWGTGHYGELGHGDRAVCFRPRVVRFFLDRSIQIAAVSCGVAHSAVVTEGTQQAYTFGDNSHGQLGTGDPSELESTAEPMLVAVKDCQGDPLPIRLAVAGPTSTIFSV
uniref:PH domain-containing protein n=1 Tax=Mucochytrium quahogii TaxID=96639 RepID=A0A7S2SFJ5_9STRA|mmetsp:Transcript_32905/g.52473  ORF Transcript_32905/g.52473 Transcript_32905/m.52473 type:complete len:2023 (-) Transcript_32905:5062-11130(-)|eukprot:CAMPEP_0203760344 /NCGR_PEP_ID=MMETSP0098-20131031/13659_1 /ASSEMBLY_ACC=CAM_ASM_000208 /TAXON_ID=96639 /ORGANISM=" , Strain NY0313808BC1" /LENGTH=2022 /DNA_ID=CAMNT_0050653865 /DNA_START=194 /DNA_END=6262 /DNA_ORIENTATION=-